MRYLILLLIPSLAAALQLTIDGETVTVRSVDIQIDDGGVELTVTPVDGGDPEPPPPEPEPLPSDCAPTDVRIGPRIDWASPGGQQLITLIEPVAYPFRTTAHPGYQGQVSTVPASSQIGFRRLWISACRGGEPIGPRCVAEGLESAVVRWAQMPDVRGTCELGTDTDYWLVMDPVDCPVGGCLLYRNIYTSGNP